MANHPIQYRIGNTTNVKNTVPDAPPPIASINTINENPQQQPWPNSSSDDPVEPEECGSPPNT
jgi:hypothetical protein